jgi:hypothetical protein
MLAFCVVSALFLGCALAVFVQWAEIGQFLATHQAWTIVALWLAGMFGIGYLLVDDAGMVSFWLLFGLFGVGAAPLVLRSSIAHYAAWRGMMDAAKEPNTRPE